MFFLFILYNFNLLQFVLLFFLSFAGSKTESGTEVRPSFATVFLLIHCDCEECGILAYFLHEQLLIFFLPLSVSFYFCVTFFFFKFYLQKPRGAQFSSIQKVRCFFSTTILIVYCVLAKFFILFLLIFMHF